MKTEHTEKVAKLQEQVKDYYLRKVPFRVFHGASNSTRMLTFKRGEVVDTSNLDQVLSVNAANNTAVVESNVDMARLLDAALQHGLIPPVVTEFPGITVGGAIQGAAAETSSFKWGCFSQTVNWIEVIVGNGDILRVSPSSHADLFYGIAGSYGSLGLITAAEVQLIPAHPYVKVTHHQVTSYEAGKALMDKAVREGCDFIEFGMVHNDLGTVIVCNFSDTVAGNVRRFTRARDPWYSTYAEKIMRNGKTVTDSIPIKDYIFRLDRGAFWTGRLIYDKLRLPFNAVTCFLLDPLMRTSKLYEAVQASGAGQRYICQDIVVPAKSLIAFTRQLDKVLGKYLMPIAICPIKPEPRSPLQCNGIATDMTYNIGIYGYRVEPYEKFVDVNRQIEQLTRKFGGKKWLYAHQYYTEQEFWEIYDKKWYEKLRQKYHATYMPDIYSRTVVKERYQIRSKKGALKTIFGKAKLQIVD